jgi:hypothetical protein
MGTPDRHRARMTLKPGHSGFLISMKPISRPLSDHALSVCDSCKEPIWVYPTQIGDRVALDDLPGPWVIDGRHTLYKLPYNSGYRTHECKQATNAPLLRDVPDDEFLWAPRVLRTKVAKHSG